MNDIKEIYSLLQNPTEKDIALMQKAYNFAMKAHEGHERLNGEPYFNHCFAETTTCKYSHDINNFKTQKCTRHCTGPYCYDKHDCETFVAYFTRIHMCYNFLQIGNMVLYLNHNCLVTKVCRHYVFHQQRKQKKMRTNCVFRHPSDLITVNNVLA